jgi:hypothetical protein
MSKMGDAHRALPVAEEQHSVPPLCAPHLHPAEQQRAQHSNPAVRAGDSQHSSPRASHTPVDTSLNHALVLQCADL